MFAENNTTYTISEYIEGVRLLDFLKDNAGELSWDVVSKLFPPLFTTVGILHNAGIIHRAISPETVYITNKGELKLSGFCISAVRTADAGLEYELFKGYAAPEQYSASSSSHQGTWTDVYSVCALLYRILTGCMPTDSRSRLENDDLCEPCRLNANIPPHVSRVIMDGMNLSGRDRIQTITELVTRLFEQPAQLRSVYAANDEYDDVNNGYQNNEYYDQQNDAPQDEYYDDAYYDDGYNTVNKKHRSDYEDNYRYEKVSTVDRIKVPVIIGILLFAILMIVAVVFLKSFLNGGGDDDDDAYYSSVSVTDNIIEETTGDAAEATTDDSNGIMLDLKGKYFESTKEKYQEYFNLVAIQEFNDEYDAGQIFEQSIEPGASFHTGDTVTVKVSKGPSSATIPDYADMTISQYEAALKTAGISEYSLIAQISATSGTPNTVLQLQVDGQQVYPGDTFNNTEGKKLIVYYLSKDAVIATEPEPTEEPTTEAVTEASTEEPTTEEATEAPTEAPAEETQAPEESENGQQDSENQDNPDENNNSDDNEYIPAEGEYG
jgi:serine/threonine-protein kinase